MALTLVEHVTADANVFQGRPCIRGTRIPVDVVYDLYEREGMTIADISANFPGVTVSDVHAALSYYHDHRREIEAMLAEDEARVERWKRDNPNLWHEFPEA